MGIDRDKIDAIIQKYDGDKSYILAIFQDIQRIYRYLPKEAIKFICERLDIPFSKGYEVATFYKSLSLKPRGKHTVHVCLGTACHLRGGPSIVDTFQRELKVKIGDTTEDGNFTFETVNCLGACALAPLVRVDNQDFGKATPGGVKKIISEFMNGE
ncbi:MAG TPA: NAD(P)H-dependent oxidoreductase subunit E [Syntrophorhabdaceae bacterium]|jgi:NADH-quinone oxidoreductase subunit E|nr:NAD(P)H-dependent oxidoreductase subunit E [Syntrophorhabdaceae bacterium]MDI9560094.1 NAD(P)H-dependent oxidoreductase subunit E [Pseudomonadota bacterium]MBP8699881.1 NAD(P)H-dependent oxidoreductase subunit E [Syntrophorhabdaceae bacterium]HNQ62359.1 NAD(P)H-dependent oxidoreductase subunit E [Syntrophorhabdaceae bacterium]HNZ58104.1 NAD(P)H-dependent oxidoreductase subunit E [Syntrophorhabdaceae bacterium]